MSPQPGPQPFSLFQFMRPYKSTTAAGRRETPSRTFQLMHPCKSATITFSIRSQHPAENFNSCTRTRTQLHVRHTGHVERCKFQLTHPYKSATSRSRCFSFLSSHFNSCAHTRAQPRTGRITRSMCSISTHALVQERNCVR